MNPQIELYADGYTKSERWLNVEGRYHRVDGPAYSYWDKNGRLLVEYWRLNGKNHRSCGPATKSLNKYNSRSGYEYRWCIDGVDITTEVEQWIKENNINLDENHCVIDKNHQIIFRLKWEKC